MSVYKNNTDRMKYSYCCEKGIRSGLMTKEQEEEFIEWMATLVLECSVSLKNRMERIKKEKEQRIASYPNG